MSDVRRRILRPAPVVSAGESRRAERKRAQLAADRGALQRWMTRLTRAFRKVERLYKRLARLERELAAGR
jgi:hypothetical protein